MTKNKNLKKSNADQNWRSNNAGGFNRNNNHSGATTFLTPPATPPANGTIPSPLPTSNGMPRKPAIPWERELVGNFLLKLADKQVINARSNWFVDKRTMRDSFEAHLSGLPNTGDIRIRLSVNGAWNIGNLLHRTNFLMNTPRGDSNYRIKSFSLCDFRKEKFNAIDEKHRQSDILDVPGNVPGLSIVEGQKHILDEEAETMPLMYQKTQKQQQIKDFELSSWGCYICQLNFDNIEKYEEHVEYHGDESDFQSLKKMEKYPSPMLKLSYQNCVNSHYFGFTLTTDQPDMIIEKFIIVQSRQFYYVYNARLPLEISESGELRFFVDSHVFMILREQPIVIGFRWKGESYVEQHHFMRTEALPKARFNINPYRLSNKDTFRCGSLAPANPPTQMFSALKHEDAQVHLAQFDKHYRNYCELDRELTQENLGGTLRTLLQVEDIERLQHYLELKQSKMELHQFGRELSVKMQTNTRNAEDVVSPGDDVLIINERATQETGSSIRQLLENHNLILELALKDFDSIKQWARKVDERFGALDKQRHEPRVYFARILGVSTQRVNITCERQLPDNTTYTLIFRPVRAVMRYQYRALQQLALTRAADVQRILFPADTTRQRVPIGALKLFNQDIANNPEQLKAVQHISLCEKFSAPYLIWGPPGTGKTATICEAIYQLYVNRPKTHILVLAGSNTACDEIALRLLRAIAQAPESQPRPLTRIFAASCDRRIDNIDDLLLEYSNMYALHFYPAVQAVHQYRIVICTLSLAGKLSTGGFARDEDKQHVFSHVFVDEAAASTETEVLMGITCTIGPTTNLTLSGDHKQLGPVLQSQRANDWGLSVSLFERLLARKCYRADENGEYNDSIQTRLIRNFRSHPEIVAVYNNLYYDGTLIAEAPMKNVCLFNNWFYTPNDNFPIMFHSVFGNVMNTKSSVSLCNNKEIDVVMDYVKDLMYFGINGQKLAQTDIGIISPYKNQYQRIQEQLNMRNWSQIDCGSVELFQGKEKQIIIVSFVRSFTPKLGFLDNRRRLNVLLSRPMSLLILIGNPKTLSQNQDFRHIIEMCRDRKTLVGSPYFIDTPVEETITIRTGNAAAQESATRRLSETPQQQQKQQQQAVKNSLGHSFKRTTKTSNNKGQQQATKLFYNKDELLKLGGLKQKSELDKIFDELPAPPQTLYVDRQSETIRLITSQIKQLKMEESIKAKASTTAATSAKSTKPIVNNPKPPTAGLTTSAASTPRPIATAKVASTIRTTVAPVQARTATPASATSTTTSHKDTIRLGSSIFMEAIEFPTTQKSHKPSAPPMTPPRATRYNLVPTESTRFEYSSHAHEERASSSRYASSRYAYVPDSASRTYASYRPPSPPRPTATKSKCIIS
ncbi:uncharacterized protein LOC6639688 isoform X2 [Drosophila willistoni]|uniref:uncharacterized protein LOC6639688 isoform X2 n=1 Tax=Drosophila willistoni TaxID=7260 RepID=UPI000C26CD3D|nr:uncharacterized protein LOC6639688 isoform X2 [Drosophila willistoni]